MLHKQDLESESWVQILDLPCENTKTIELYTLNEWIVMCELYFYKLVISIYKL